MQWPARPCTGAPQRDHGSAQGPDCCVQTVRRSLQKGRVGLRCFYSSLTGDLRPIESSKKKVGLVFYVSCKKIFW